jgi:cell division protein FtsQ
MSGATLALRRLPAAGTIGRRLLAGILALAVLAAGYWFWLRDSSLVAVKNVEIVGVSGIAGSDEIRTALNAAARDMTTLHLRPELLGEATARFPLVKSVTADPDFPSSLTVRVTERRPAALIGDGEEAVVVAGDGVILTGLPAAKLELPSLPIGSPPKGGQLQGPVLDQALVLGAVPTALQPYIESSSMGATGVEVELRGGIELRFGDSREAGRKWRAAAAVLADPELTMLDYVDLTAPARPAVGGSGYVLPVQP